MSEVRLKYVARLNERVLREDTDPDRPLRYIDIGSINAGALSLQPSSMLFGEAPSRARRLVRSGDTIISTVRTYLRAVWHVTGDTDDLVVSTGFAVLSPLNPLDHRYFGWWAQSEPFISEIVSRSVGVSYPAISPDDVSNVQIEVPPLDEQRRIADFLDVETARIDALIAKKRRMIELLRERWEASLSRAAMGRLTRLRRVLQSIEQGWSPDCDQHPAEPDEWGVLKAGCVNHGVFHEDENKTLPSEIPPRPEYEVHRGDVLMSRASGSTELIGSVAILRSVRQKLIMSDKIFRLKFDEQLVDARYIVSLMASRDVRDQIVLGVSGGSGLANNIPTNVVKDLVISLPNMEQQRRIADRLEAERTTVDLVRKKLDRQIELLQERRQALITYAVTGQLPMPA